MKDVKSWSHPQFASSLPHAFPPTATFKPHNNKMLWGLKEALYMLGTKQILFLLPFSSWVRPGLYSFASSVVRITENVCVFKVGSQGCCIYGLVVCLHTPGTVTHEMQWNWQHLGWHHVWSWVAVLRVGFSCGRFYDFLLSGVKAVWIREG